jgi:hypothetical protein
MIMRGDCFFAAIDEDACSPEASHIRERHGLVVKQKVQDRPGHSPSKRGTDWRATAAPGSFCLIVAEFHLAKRRVEAHIREMVQTWRSGPGEEFTCPHCGAAYEVTINRLPTREADQATCQVCHKIMNRWSSTASPSYKLKSQPAYALRRFDVVKMRDEIEDENGPVNG